MSDFKKTIDIDRILHDKMGDKAKFVPSLLVRWLKHIVHEDVTFGIVVTYRVPTGWKSVCAIST